MAFCDNPRGRRGRLANGACSALSEAQEYGNRLLGATRFAFDPTDAPFPQTHNPAAAIGATDARRFRGRHQFLLEERSGAPNLTAKAG